MEEDGGVDKDFVVVGKEEVKEEECGASDLMKD